MPEREITDMNSKQVNETMIRLNAFMRDVKVKQKPGWQSEKTILGNDGKRLRPDAIDPQGRPIELKPNSPTGRSRGEKQLKKYEEALGKKGRVVYYEP